MNKQSKLQRLNAFINERDSRSDWDSFLSRDRMMVHRQLLCNHCGFPRSTLYQNPSIKMRLETLENELRQRKLLATSIVHHGVDDPKLEEDIDLDVQIAALEVRLQIASERIHETKADLERLLSDTMLEAMK